MSNLVLSDVDGTILKGSLVLNHACELHFKKILDLKEHPEAWLADMKNEDLIVNLANAYRKGLVGMTARELNIPFFLDTLTSKDENFYSTLERLLQHQKDGDEVHLVSGSPNFILSVFAKRLGFYHAGSHYNRKRDGKFTGDVTLMAGSDAKRQYVSSLEPQNYDYIVAYGDTASDSPLFEAANHSVLVDPNKETESNLTKIVQEIIRS